MLPDQEQRIARMVSEGQKPHDIAMVEGISAGLGADTDPGVTGGYGDPGFGSIDNEPPIPVSEEPEEGAQKIEGPRQSMGKAAYPKSRLGRLL
jgi:hypothetical protein